MTLSSQNGLCMADPIAEHYSKLHQTGGFYKHMGHKGVYSVSMQKPPPENYLKRVSGENAHVGSKDYGVLASQARKAQKGKRKCDSDSASDGESQRTINKKHRKRRNDSDSGSDESSYKKKKKKISKHKRNRISEALGDDT